MGKLSLPSVADFGQTVKQSSTNLVTLYSGIVEQIKDGPPKVQKLVAWVVYGRRPLAFQELEAALATQMDSKSKDGTEEHRFDLTRGALNSAAGIILEIINNTVHLIHQSAKDFILRERKLVGASCFNGLDLIVYVSGVFFDIFEFRRLSERALWLQRRVKSAEKRVSSS